MAAEQPIEIDTLELRGDKKEYERFIQSIIDKRLPKFEPTMPEGASGYVPTNPPECTAVAVYDRIIQKPYLARTAFPDELLAVETRYFIVKLKDETRELDILIRSIDLYLVGYKGKNGKGEVEKWILLETKNIHLRNQVTEWFEHISVEPVRTNLGDSYAELFGACRSVFKDESDKKVKAALLDFIREKITTEANNVTWWTEMENKLNKVDYTSEMLLKALKPEAKDEKSGNNLKQRKKDLRNMGLKLTRESDLEFLHTQMLGLHLNREALRNAVTHLKNESFTNIESAQHVITLVIMIPEAVRFKQISNCIISYYTLPGRVTLTADMAHLIQKWTRGSKIIASLGLGVNHSIDLGGNQSPLCKFLEYFSCLKGTECNVVLRSHAGGST